MLTTEDVPPGFFMYQVATQFTYYHERGHLIQQSPYLRTGVNEKSSAMFQTQFDPLRHLLEFDADYHAAHLVCFHIIEFWKKLGDGKMTNESIKLLLSLAISGIFTLSFTSKGQKHRSIMRNKPIRTQWSGNLYHGYFYQRSRDGNAWKHKT